MSFILKNVQLTFPELYKPVSFNNGPLKYSASILLKKDSEQLKKVEDAISKRIKHASLKDGQALTCLIDGDSKDYEGYAGNMILKVKNDTRRPPALFDLDGKTRLYENSGKMLSGDIINIKIGFYYFFYREMNTHHVLCNLIGAQYVKSGAFEQYDGCDFEDLTDDEKSLL